MLMHTHPPLPPAKKLPNMVFYVKIKPHQLYNQTSCSASFKIIVASLVWTQNDHLDQEKGGKTQKKAQNRAQQTQQLGFVGLWQI